MGAAMLGDGRLAVNGVVWGGRLHCVAGDGLVNVLVSVALAT